MHVQYESGNSSASSSDDDHFLEYEAGGYQETGSANARSPLVVDLDKETSTEPPTNIKPFPIYLKRNGKEHLMVPHDTEDHSVFPSASIFYYTLEEVFAVVRQFFKPLEDNQIKFSNEELVLSIEVLKLVVTEDNIYNKDISFNDMVSIFEILCNHSKERNEPYPESLVIAVSTQKRFITQYNTLADMVTDGGCLSNVLKSMQPNTCENPIILSDDDDGTPVARTIVKASEIQNDQGYISDDETSNPGSPQKLLEYLPHQEPTTEAQTLPPKQQLFITDDTDTSILTEDTSKRTNEEDGLAHVTKKHCPAL